MHSIHSVQCVYAYQASQILCLHAIQPPERMYSQHMLVIFTALFVNGGKTYTMMGETNPDGSGVPGLYLLATQDIFQLLNQP